MSTYVNDYKMEAVRQWPQAMLPEKALTPPARVHHHPPGPARERYQLMFIVETCVSNGYFNPVKFRESKVDTKGRLLDAAARLFSEKGFRDTTIQEISQLAGANVAAVNYHFGSKDRLYMEVWQLVASIMHDTYVKPMLEITSPEERLRQIIKQRIQQTFDEGPAGHLRKLAFREMSGPTGSREKAILKLLRPFRDLLLHTVGQLLNRKKDDPVTQRCEFSLHSQLIFLNVLRMRDRQHCMEFLSDYGKHPSPAQIDELSSHISTFVLGGIKATANSTGR